MTDEKSGWALLHSKLPPAAIRPLSKDVYGVEGLSDVNEAYLIQRLFASGLVWEWRLAEQTWLGNEDRAVRGKDYTMRYYLASVKGELVIDGRVFHGAGASDNRKLDAAFKGAATVAFKNAAKMAGLTIELFKDGRAMDFIYEDRQGNVVGAGASQGPADEGNGSTTASAVAVNQPAPPTPPSAPPQTPTAAPERSARSVGPKPKRQNVVQAPQTGKVAPEVPAAPVAQADPVPGQSALAGLTDAPFVAPQDDGLGPQRELVRQVAAELAHVNALLRNALEHALKGEAAEVVPPKEPNPTADAGIAARIAIDWPGKALATLGPAELQGLLERFEMSLSKKRAIMTERGLKE